MFLPSEFNKATKGKDYSLLLENASRLTGRDIEFAVLMDLMAGPLWSEEDPLQGALAPRAAGGSSTRRFHLRP